MEKALIEHETMRPAQFTWCRSLSDEYFNAQDATSSCALHIANDTWYTDNKQGGRVHCKHRDVAAISGLCVCAYMGAVVKKRSILRWVHDADTFPLSICSVDSCHPILAHPHLKSASI